MPNSGVFSTKYEKRHKSTLTLQPVCYFNRLWDIKMWSGSFNQAEIFIPKFWPYSLQGKVSTFNLPHFQLPWPIKPLFFWEVWHHIAECCRGRKRDIDARGTFFHHFSHVSEETLHIFLCISSFSYRSYLLPDYPHPADVGLQQYGIILRLAVPLPVWGICRQPRSALHKLRATMKLFSVVSLSLHLTKKINEKNMKRSQKNYHPVITSYRWQIQKLVLSNEGLSFLLYAV